MRTRTFVRHGAMAALAAAVVLAATTARPRVLVPDGRITRRSSIFDRDPDRYA